MKWFVSLSLLFSWCCLATVAAEEAKWVKYPGKAGPGTGKHVVLVSGDEEYRSEEALPALGKILSQQHGFDCTVLFAIDPKDGTINPMVNSNIPGLEALKTADLMIIFTRFRNLPDEQMQHIDDYLKSGKPVIGIRTATHAFNVPKANEKWHKYSYNASGVEGWQKGFGRLVLGETWVNHHGGHNSQSCRGIIPEAAKQHPIVTGIKDGDIWGPSDVYGVNLPLPEGCEPVVLGQVLTGMKSDDPPLEGKKNDPMMPIAWTKTYTIEPGKTGKVFTSTMGCAGDMSSAGYRRMLVNASYWCLGLESQIKADSNVDLIGDFQALPFKSGGHRKDVKPTDHALTN
jgi:hypothetical protein